MTSQKDFRSRLKCPFKEDQISPQSELGQKLLTAAKVPSGKAPQFLTHVSASIKAYLQVANVPPPSDIRKEVVDLGSEVVNALKNPTVEAGEGVARRVATLTSEARDSIEWRASPLVQALTPLTRRVLRSMRGMRSSQQKKISLIPTSNTANAHC
jgi:hypothetical protein